MSDDRLIPESPALWWVETTDGVRSILRVVVDHNGSDTYLGFLAFEKLPRGDGSSWPVERFTGRWLAPVMLHEEVERAASRVTELEGVLRDLLPGSERVNDSSVESHLATGRYYLRVAGVVTAVEGDVCRDVNFGKTWAKEDIMAIEEKFNAPIRAALEGGQDG